MSALREFLPRLSGFFSRRSGSPEGDLRDELRLHAEMLEADLRGRGVGAEEARRLARESLGTILLGFAIAVLSTRFLSGQLYGVGPLDPQAMVGAVLLLLGAVALAADGLPIGRALRANPSVAF